MKFIPYAAAFIAALSACDQVSSDDGGTGGDTPAPPAEGVAAAVRGNLEGATFDAANETLVVTLRSLDGDTVSTAYARNPDYDQGSYIAFTQQDDPLDRFATGMAATSADGSSQAVLVVDGGQFNRYFGGVNYAQIGTYTAPTSGLASYAGDYVGLLNVSTTDGTLPSGANPDILPERPGQVTGDVFLNVDFADNAVNGAIYNRVDVDGVGINVDTVFLPVTDLNDDGSFAGTAENRGLEGVGSYAGVLGGTNGSSMSGGVFIDDDTFLGIDGAEEYGIFVLSQCGTAGEAAICNDENVEDVNE